MVVRSVSVAAFSALCWLIPAPASAVEICVVADVRLPPLELKSTVDVAIASVRHCPRPMPSPLPPVPSPPVPAPPVPAPPGTTPPGTPPPTSPAPPLSRPSPQRPSSRVPAGRPVTAVPEALGVAPMQLVAAPSPNPPCPQPAPANDPLEAPPSAVPERTIAAPKQDEVQTERRWAVAVLVVVIGASIAIRRIFRDPSP
ncbi:hypothetical protein [Amycolatopsis pigmentata]|uniref:Uncharacterized protein n=1 Tax=Amycolatopsis pigmentata TaxID=450801 RepID=A0ABW5G5E0_9PSEU